MTKCRLAVESGKDLSRKRTCRSSLEENDAPNALLEPMVRCSRMKVALDRRLTRQPTLLLLRLTPSERKRMRYRDYECLRLGRKPWTMRKQTGCEKLMETLNRSYHAAGSR